MREEKDGKRLCLIQLSPALLLALKMIKVRAARLYRARAKRTSFYMSFSERRVQVKRGKGKSKGNAK